MLPWIDTLSSGTLPYVIGQLPMEFLRFPDIASPFVNKYAKSVIYYLVALTKYAIWKVRNIVKFERKKVSKYYILITFLSLLKFRILVDFARFSLDNFSKYWLINDNFCTVDNDKIVCNFM